MAKLTNVTIEYDNSSIKNKHISSTAADRIDCDKSSQLFVRGTNFGFVIGGTPTTREEIVYVANGPGTIRGFHALLKVGGTSSASSTFDLKKNGTTVLSGVVTFAAADTDAVPKDGTLSVTSFTTDDILSIAMTVSDSTGASGPYAWAVIDETYCPTA